MTILITGASRGIGAELALQLAAEGHRLILLSRSENDLRRQCDKCNSLAAAEIAFPYVYDLRQILSDAEGFYRRLTALTDSLDILVNNAGKLSRKPFEELTTTEAHEIFDVNYFAPAELIRICLPLLKKSDAAAIINVSSMAAFPGTTKFPGLSAYGASKGALSTLTESLAVEFKDLNIKVNALAFGAVQTEMFAEAFPQIEAPTSAAEMGKFFKWFVLEGWKSFSGKVLPVSISTP